MNHQYPTGPKRRFRTGFISFVRPRCLVSTGREPATSHTSGGPQEVYFLKPDPSGVLVKHQQITKGKRER